MNPRELLAIQMRIQQQLALAQIRALAMVTAISIEDRTNSELERDSALMNAAILIRQLEIKVHWEPAT